MGERIGIVAGSGAYVGRILSELKSKGETCVVGVEGETEPKLEGRAGSFLWVRPGELGKAVRWLKSEDVRNVLLIGKVRPAALLAKDHFDAAAKLVWEKTASKSPARALRSVIAFLEQNGLEVRSPLPFLKPFFCREGALTGSLPSSSLLEDMDFGLAMARRLADWDVGQTVIVKDGIVVAVEGLEGTDQAILRGGELAGPGIVVAKAGRSDEDMRIDVPGVGLKTIKTLIRAKAVGLAIEAGKVAFFEKGEALALAEAHGIAIVARRVSEGGG